MQSLLSGAEAGANYTVFALGIASHQLVGWVEPFAKPISSSQPVFVGTTR